MPYSEAEKDKIVAEAMDPQKVQIFCGLHHYYGPVPSNPRIGPTLGCARCWFVYYLHDIASVPPHKRQERLEELEMVVRQVAEAVMKKEFDYEVFDHPQIHIEKDAL